MGLRVELCRRLLLQRTRRGNRCGQGTTKGKTIPAFKRCYALADLLPEGQIIRQQFRTEMIFIALFHQITRRLILIFCSEQFFLFRTRGKFAFFVKCS